MKQIICGLFVLAIWSPYIAVASAIEQQQLQSILQEFITILEIRKGQLEQLLATQSQGQFKLATRQTLSGFGATLPLKKRGSGGHNQPKKDVPAATSTVQSPSIQSDSYNTITVDIDEVHVLSKITINPDNFPEEISLPNQLVLMVKLVSEASFEIILPYNVEAQQYELEDLSGYLGEDKNWSGTLTVLVPVEIISYKFSYGMELNIDGKLYDEVIVNPGHPVIEIVTDGLAVPQIGYSPKSGASDITLWPIIMNNLGQGKVFVETIVFTAVIDNGESLAEFFSEIRIEDNAGRAYIGVIDDSKIVFSGLDIEIEGGSTLAFNIKADFPPSSQESSLLLKFDTADIGARDAYGEEYKLPEGYLENDLLYLVEEGLTFQDDLIVAETQWLGPDNTVGEFILTFAFKAVGSDFYVRSDMDLINNPIESGVGYVVNGDYGSGTAIVSLQIESEEVSNDVYVIRSGEVVNIILTLQVTTSVETDISVGLRELWYSTNNDGVTDADVAEFAPGEVETEFLFLRPVGDN